MPTELRLTQVKGIPNLTSNDVNKALVYKGSNTFAFEASGASEIAGIQSTLVSLDTRIDTLEATSITTVDGGTF